MKQVDRFIEQPVRQRRSADRFKQNRHRHRRGAHPFDGPVHHRMAEQRWNDGKGEKTKPIRQLIRRQRKAKQHRVQPQHRRTNAIDDICIRHERQPLAHFLAEQPVRRHHRARHQRQHVPIERFAADAKIAPANQDASRNRQNSACERARRQPLTEKERPARKGEQRLQRHKHDRAGDGSIVERFKPKNKMKRKQHAGTNRKPPVASGNTLQFADMAKKKRRHDDDREKKPIKRDNGRRRLRPFDENGRCRHSKRADQ